MTTASTDAAYLLPQHVADLRKSGLTDETIAASGLRSETDQEKIIRLLGRQTMPDLGPCLVIPFRKHSGEFNGFARVRPDNPRRDDKGKPIKYEQPPGESNRAYFPPLAIQAIGDFEFSDYLGIVEGEKKALAACQAGLPTIGLTGVWNWQKKRDDRQKDRGEQRRLIDDLERGVFWRIPLHIFICFDTDPRINPGVEQAQAELARVIEDHFSKATIVRLPSLRGADGLPTKMGADDFIAEFGEDAFRELVESQLKPRPAKQSIENYQQYLVQRRTDSVGQKGIAYLDRSPTGSGKSTADFPAMAKAGRSLTVLGTHKNCEEQEKEMQKRSMDAKAYPQLNEETCQNLEVALKAKNHGLSPSSAICPSCKYQEGCEYWNAMREAESAPHSIATHMRASKSFAELAEGRSYVAIHEDPASLLRPSLEIKGKLEDVEKLANHVCWDCQEWNKGSAPFFNYMADAARFLKEQLSEVVQDSRLDLPSSIGAPRNAHADLFRMMEREGIWPDGDAVRICMGLAAGDVAELCIRVDRSLKKGGDPQIFKSLVAYWQTLLPSHSVTWIADATADPDEIRELSNLPLEDITSGHEIEQLKTVHQIPIDVTKGTSRPKVVSILTSILLDYPAANRIGIICDRKHAPAITGTAKEGPVLGESFRQRISKVQAFRSGIRGSNRWTEECDLLIVLGTPRVSMPAIKDRLMRNGKAYAAAREESETGWGKTYWGGRTVGGHRITIETLGYRDRDWQNAYQNLVRAELLQCVGRCRAIRESGIPAVVFTNEDLGLPIIEKTKKLFSSAQIFTLKAILKIFEGRFSASSQNELTAHSPKAERPVLPNDLTAQSPKYIYLAKCAVSSSEVAAAVGKGERRVRIILDDLASLKAVERIGQRGGWRFAERGLLAAGWTDESSGSAPAAFTPAVPEPAATAQADDF